MRFVNVLTAAAAVATLAFAAAPAQALTWNAVADFHGAPNTGNGVWSYGFGSASSFTEYDVFAADCVTDGDCWKSSQFNYSLVPTVIKNTISDPIYYYTVTHASDMLNVHPGADSDVRTGGADLDSFVRFTAPTAGSYRYAGFFRVADNAAPNGVNVYAGAFSSALTGPFGTTVHFDGTVSLGAGDSIDFRVNRDGDYYFDSTGLAATVTAVPEPGAWALMIGGFGMAGAVLRRRRALAA